MNALSNVGYQTAPVLKIGAVVLRANGDVLVLQPIPKHAGEVPPFVLPRGSRQYCVEGAWFDARDAATGLANAATLEPFERGLAREIEEEGGVTPEQLARAQVIELGTMDFSSRSKGIYPIYWFVVVPCDADSATLGEQIPQDALSVRWASLEAIQSMTSTGAFSAGYLPVIEAALAATRAHGAV